MDLLNNSLKLSTKEGDKILFQKVKTKHKNRHTHTINPRLAEYEPCQLCKMFPASQTHEIYHNGSAYMRNLSIEYGAQLLICDSCHRLLHSNPRLEDTIKANHQSKIMIEHDMSMDRWIELFNKNYL